MNNRQYYGRNMRIKSERISVQVSRREKEKLEKLAEDRGQTISEFIRQKAIYEPWRDLFYE